MVPHPERLRVKETEARHPGRAHRQPGRCPSSRSRGVPGTVLERGAVTTLKYPIAVFIIAVCCVIGLGVAVLEATGNGSLEPLALTCAPPSAHDLGPPSALFTAHFPGPVSLLVPVGIVDVPPLYEICDYQVRTPKSPLTGVDLTVEFGPDRLRLASPSKAKGITRLATGDASGDELVNCDFGLCRGLIIVQTRRSKWFVVASGTNAQVIRVFFRSFRVTGY